jgi:hypothetical protein
MYDLYRLQIKLWIELNWINFSGPGSSVEVQHNQSGLDWNVLQKLELEDMMFPIFSGYTYR